MCQETCVKVTLLLYNILFLILGLGVLAVGLYVRLVGTELDDVIGSSLIPSVTLLCIVAGGIVVFVSLVGCAGTLLQNRVLLLVYIGFLLLVFVLEVTSGILGLVNYNKVEEILDENMKPAMLEMYGYEANQLVTTAVDTMQYNLECCGYNLPTDWHHSSFFKDTTPALVTSRGDAVMPISCCTNTRVAGCNEAHNDLTRYSMGCKEKVKEIMLANLMILGMGSVAICTFQLLGVALVISLFVKSGDDVEEF